MGDMDDLAQLRDQFPGWQFGTVWVSANSGPDQRQVWARCGGVLLTAWTVPELRAVIEASGR